MDTRFSWGNQMIRLRELMQGDPCQSSLDRLMPALSALSNSSFAVINQVEVDRDGDPLQPQDKYDRVQTGRHADKTFLAVTLRPGFTDMGPG